MQGGNGASSLEFELIINFQDKNHLILEIVFKSQSCLIIILSASVLTASILSATILS